jgi:hypothetical protein
VISAESIHIYVAPGLETGELGAILAELGLEAKIFDDETTVAQPALLVLHPGQKAPEGLKEMVLAPPTGASRETLREMLRVAMENSALKHEVKVLEEQARRQHRQFEELNRIGIALSAERDIGKLQ